MVHPNQEIVISESWQLVGTLIYRKDGPRESKTLPLIFQSHLIRVNLRFLSNPAPKYFKAGWINQVVRVQGGGHILPGFIVPVQPSAFDFEVGRPSQIRFKPVQYLFPCVILFYRSV